MTSGGFTIIEVVLFLAITGMLVTGILAGAGYSIDMQRYRDGAVSLQTALQKQYSEVLNVSNGTRATAKCGTVNRGQSECVILGRYVTLSKQTSDGQTAGQLTSENIVASVVSSGLDEVGDLEALRTQYTYSLDPESRTSTDMEWQTTPSVSGSPGTDLLMTMVILRSPSSGLVYTFTKNGISSGGSASTISNNIASMAEDTLRAERTICVNPNGIMFGEKLAVVLKAQSSGRSAVEVRSNGMLPEDQKC